MIYAKYTTRSWRYCQVDEEASKFQLDGNMDLVYAVYARTTILHFDKKKY